MSSSNIARVGACALGITALCTALVSTASAQTGLPIHAHVVHEGDTLASIAQLYYGDPRREAALVAENGLAGEGGQSIVVGMRLVIPAVVYHVVLPGEDWSDIARKYFGDARRSFVFAEANNVNLETGPPAAGAEILVPYPLRHVADQRQTLSDIALRHYNRTSIEDVASLKRFNRLRSPRMTRGQVVLVPVKDLVLSAEGKRVVQANRGLNSTQGAARSEQTRVESEIPRLRILLHEGRYVEVVALGNRLLGAAALTGNQTVSIQRELGFALIALDREDLATRAFASALALQPDLELDSVRTSPRVLEAFRAARQHAGRQ